ELLTHLEPLRTLLVSVAAEVATLDEAHRAVVANLDVETRILDRPDCNGDRLALPASARSRRTTGARGRTRAAAFELLHAERNALLFDVDVEHLRLNRLALAVKLQRLLARHAPRDVRHVDHAVNVALEPHQPPDSGRILAS